MTDRDPIATALEDLRKKEVAERATRSPEPDPVFDALANVNLEKIPASLEVVKTVDVELPDDPIEELLSKHHIGLQRSAAPPLGELKPVDPRTARVERIALVRALTGFTGDRSVGGIKRLFDTASLRSIGARELAVLSPDMMGVLGQRSFLIGFGQSTFSDAPMQGNTRVYPAMYFDANGMTMTGAHESARVRGVYYAILLASKPLRKPPTS